MQVQIDSDGQAVLEFTQKRISTDKLVAVAEGVRRVPVYTKGTMLCPLVIFSVQDKFEISGRGLS